MGGSLGAFRAGKAWEGGGLGGGTGGLHPPSRAYEQVMKSPLPLNPLRAEPRFPCSALLAITHLGDSTILLHEQGRPTVGRQGLPIIPADTAEQ